MNNNILYFKLVTYIRNTYFCCNINENRLADFHEWHKGMANKEKIDYLLLDIRELETLVAGMRDAEVYPVSFFGQTFDLTHKILKDLHALETAQIETLRKQMEEHQALIQSIPTSATIPVQTEQVQAEIEPVIQEPEIKRAVTEETAKKALSEEKPEEGPAVTQPTPIMTPAEEIRQELPTEKESPAKPEPNPVKESEAPVVGTSEKVISAERPGLFLNDLLEKKNLSDFRKAFSLNDRFRFRRELFGGDEARMNKVINDLNDLHSYEDSVTYLNNELKWNIEDEAVADFIKLLEKRFL